MNCTERITENKRRLQEAYEDWQDAEDPDDGLVNTAVHLHVLNESIEECRQ